MALIDVPGAGVAQLVQRHVEQAQVHVAALAGDAGAADGTQQPEHAGDAGHVVDDRVAMGLGRITPHLDALRFEGSTHQSGRQRTASTTRACEPPFGAGWRAGQTAATFALVAQRSGR